jgi:outer membrane protein TolC
MSNRLLLLLAVLAPAPLRGQGEPAPPRPILPLSAALARADSHAYANRAAGAGVDLRSAQRSSTLRGLLPTVRAEMGYLRTTDPLNAFGFSLRQRSVTMASFDPNALNYPEATGNFGTGLVAELPLINADVWAGRSAASAASAAEVAASRWTRASSRLDVLRAYYGGVLAREKVGALEAGHAAALSYVKLARSLHEQGLVTRSDALLADVKAGEVEAQLLDARGDLGLATRQLALAMGTPDDTAFALPATLPEEEAIAGLAVSPDTALLRADLEAARLGRDAADKDLTRTKALLLPRVNAFGRYDWNTPDTPFGGKPAWTVGVMASWSFFSGYGEFAEQRAAKARAAQAGAMVEAAEAQARLDVAARRKELDVARATVAIAERAVAQTAEARRIVARKYEGGLATVTELLEANALEIRSRLERSAAQYRALVAAAAWRQALGGDGTELTTLDADGN